MQRKFLSRHQVGKFALVFLIVLPVSPTVVSQENTDSIPVKDWNNSAVILAIFTPDNSFLLPIAYLNYKRWHFESRYNYENFQTFSTFVGYNLHGSEKVKYLLTAMLGGVVGQTDGIAPGFEMDLVLGRFGFYTEAEYVFDLNTSQDSYFYGLVAISVCC